MTKSILIVNIVCFMGDLFSFLLTKSLYFIGEYSLSSLVYQKLNAFYRWCISDETLFSRRYIGENM